MDFGRQPQEMFIFFFNKSFIKVKNRLHAENQLPILVIPGDSYEEDINLDFGRRPQEILIFFFHKSFIYDKNMLHTKNQLHIFVISGDSYEEDL